MSVLSVKFHSYTNKRSAARRPWTSMCASGLLLRPGICSSTVTPLVISPMAMLVNGLSAFRNAHDNPGIVSSVRANSKVWRIIRAQPPDVGLAGVSIVSERFDISISVWSMPSPLRSLDSDMAPRRPREQSEIGLLRRRPDKHNRNCAG